MKKLKIIILLLFFMFIFTNNVKAETTKFIAGDFISNTYLKKVASDGRVKYMQARFIIDSSNNKFAYCLDPFINISLDSDYQKYSSLDKRLLNIDENKWNLINLYAYYGYGYTGHQTPQWYAATQIAIWRVMEPETNSYFTNTLNGNRDLSYEYMVSEIQNLANDFLNKDRIINVNTTYDVPKVIDTLDSSFNIQLEDTDIKVDSRYNLILKKGFKGTKSYKIYYGDDNYSSFFLLDGYQRVLEVNGMLKHFTTYNITIESGNLSVDYNIVNNYYSNCISDTKTIYGLYDINNNLISEMNIENLTHFEIKDLSYGKYYIKQISFGCSYKKDLNVYEINIDSKNSSINIDVNKDFKNINITKEYCSDDLCQDEDNAKFLISDDKKEFELITNNNGKASINLGIGTFKIHQISGKDNYKLIDDFNFNLLDYNNDIITFKLKNNIRKGIINIIVKDDEENYIKDSKICLYNEVYELIECKDTNSNGNVVFNNIKLGIYYVKQEKVNNNYILNYNEERIILKDIEELVIINKKNNEEIKKSIINNAKDDGIGNISDDLEYLNNNSDNTKYKEEYIPDTSIDDTKKYFILIICLFGIGISIYVQENKTN